MVVLGQALFLPTPPSTRAACCVALGMLVQFDFHNKVELLNVADAKVHGRNVGKTLIEFISSSFLDLQAGSAYCLRNLAARTANVDADQRRAIQKKLITFGAIPPLVEQFKYSKDLEVRTQCTGALMEICISNDPARKQLFIITREQLSDYVDVLSDDASVDLSVSGKGGRR